MIEEQLEEITKDIANYKEYEPYILDIESIENHSGQIMNLIKNENTFEYPLRNEYYKFKFIEPIYIDKVTFKTKDNIDIKGLEIVFIDYLNKSNTMTFTKKEHTVWTPKKVIKEFKIKAPKRLINKIILTDINMIGLELNDLEFIKENLLQLKNSKSNLQALADEIANKDIDLNNKIQNTEEQITEYEKVINNLNLDVNELKNNIIPQLKDNETLIKEDINKLSIKKESLESDNTNLTNNVEQLTEKSNQLNINISNQTNELKKLTDDTNIFATEMKEYIEQGNNDIKLYTILSIIPWLLIALVSIIVFFGASNLTTIINNKEDIEIATVFWSRVPFVLIVISILFVSYEISKIFIKNIIHIHKQKRIFTKIGVLAKDVAEQSILDLEIDEKEKFELRTKLKMDLLKSHLKNEIGEDYEYKVKTSLIEYLPYFKEKLKQATSKNEE